MSRMRVMVAVIAAVFAMSLVISPLLCAQDKGEIKRHVLEKHDLATVPNHEGILAQVELMPGAAEGKHTHPGELLGNVQDGTLTLHVEGKPDATLKSGESFFIPADTIHWGENKGTTPVKVVAAFVVPKGKPLTTPAK